MESILLGIFVFISVLSSGQTNPALPFPSDARWVYFNYPNEMFWKDEFPQQTNLLYDSLDSWYFLSSLNQCPNGSTPTQNFSTYKYITQIGNKWYYGNELYFDWDVQEGDSIHFPGTQIGGTDVIINNIDTIITADFVQRRTYHLLWYGVPDPIVPYIDGVEFYFIEGIGATVFGIDEWSYGDRVSYFTCFYDKNGLEIYHQDFPEINVYDCCYYVGVEEEQGMLMQLFPSPASDHITLQFGNGPLPTEVKIFNALGTLVQIEAVNGRQQLQLNTSNFASGVYTVVAQGVDGVVGKFVRE